MNLLDRYLAAVRQSLFLVPSQEKEDIVRELGEELRSEFEEKESELGRALTESEQNEILQRFGHPTLVAGRFRQGKGSVAFGRQIIGPELFPLYRFVLALNIAIVSVILAALAIFNDSHISVGTVVMQLLFHVAVVTLIFAIQDAAIRKSATSGWTTQSIPEPRDRNRIDRASSIFEIVFLVLFVSIWIDLPWFPDSFVVVHRGVPLHPGTVWNDFQRLFFVPVLLVLSVSLVLSVMNLVRPYWTRSRLALDAATNFASAAMLGVVLARNWAEVKMLWLLHSVDHIRASQIEIANAWVNIGVFTIMSFICVIAAIEALWGVVKIVRWKPVPNGIPNLAH